MKLADLLQELLDLILPPACEGCGAVGKMGLCDDCTQKIILVQAPLCAHCGFPFDPSLARAPQLCSYCGEYAPMYDAARAYAMHSGPLRQAIIAYKFRGRMAIAPFLARLLAERLAAESTQLWPLPVDRIEALVPIPLHHERKQWRGFDQAAVLARHLGKLVDMPVWEHCLTRHRPTLPQVGLSMEERLENVQNAFAVTDAEAVRGRTVLMVDDVYTTGATAADAARALKSAGVEAVYLLTITRTVPDWHPAFRAESLYDDAYH